MLKKWFGIVKKRQKSESVKEEGEVILKNEKILSEEKLIDEEGVVVNIDNQILTKVVNDDNEIEEKIIEEDLLISENTIKLDDKEAIINDKNIELCKKEVQVESEKIGLNKFEGLDQNENYNLEKNVIEEKKVSECLTEEDLEYIKEIKIKRGKSIKAINLYTKEEWVFDTHIQCSKKLKVPLGYIRENLKYGYMDYFGDAINYLSEVLNIDEYCKSEWSYLDNSKSPSEIFNILNNKIFSIRLSNEKRNEILTND
ncbi:TPA: hypothetical protein MJF48_003617, partial [Clostridioides difficile]|nr:hypothetical protein [Clostridioides difficile]